MNRARVGKKSHRKNKKKNVNPVKNMVRIENEKTKISAKVEVMDIRRLLRKFRRLGRTLVAGLSQEFRKLNLKHQEICLGSRKIRLNLRKLVGGALIAVLVISGSVYYFVDYATAAYIDIDGQQLGLVASVAAGQNMVQSVLEEAGKPVGQTAKTDHKVGFRRAWVTAGANGTGSINVAQLEALLKPYVDAYAIKVAGAEVAEVPTLQDANAVLVGLKDFYSQPGDSEKITSVEFQEDVTTGEVKAQPKAVETVAQALARFERGKEIDKEYTVQPKDSLWLIARKNDMLTKDVVSSNPGLSEKSAIKPGQKLKLVSFVPYLNVISKGEYAVTETIPYKIITRPDFSLGSGETQVKAQGSEGRKTVTYSFVERNGRISQRTILNEKITQQPVDRIVAEGPTSSGGGQPVELAISQAPASRGADRVSRLIDNALSLQGIPYLWGGTTRNGFDCSGFVQYVFKASGIYLPRTSFEQFNLGVPVSRNELQPGDLVFFNTYGRASDVRIYIGGGLTVGSSSDGVSIHSISESYWSSHYLGAKRIPIN